MAATNFIPPVIAPKPSDNPCNSILAIDCNAIGYAAMYQPELSRMSHNGESTSALHGLPISIFGLMKRFPDAMPLLLWDGHCQWRYDLHPEYKSGRSDDPVKVEIRASYKRQSEVLRVMLLEAGFPTVCHRDVEADDLAGMICRNVPGDTKIIMATHDSDWVQAISENASWFDTRNKRIVDLDYLKSNDLNSADGVVECPETYLTAKCMSGDSSDTIDGVKGVGIKTAIKFLTQYGSFENLWAAYDQGESMKGAKLISLTTASARSTYEFNRKLMDWCKAEIPLEVHYSMWKQDIEAAKSIAADYGLKQLSKTLDYALPQDKWRTILNQVEFALAADAERPTLAKLRF